MPRPRKDAQLIGEFGKKLQQTLIRQGRTQTELAEISGLQPSQISDMLAGAQLTIPNIAKLLKGLITLHITTSVRGVNDWLALIYVVENGFGKLQYVTVLPEGMRGKISRATIKDLGTQHEQELRELIRQIKEDRTKVPEKLPIFKTSTGLSVIGRDEVIQEILELIDQEQFVTIDGAPGIGKTEVAKQVAKKAKQRGHFTHVKLFYFVNETNTSHAIKQVMTVTDKLPPRERALLILDNCEQLEGLTQQLLELIEEHEYLHILTTSRTLMSPTRRTLDPLTFPHSIVLRPDQLLSYQSVQLLLEAAAKATGKRVEINEDNAEAIAEICRYFEGLPMALLIVGAMIRRYSFESILQEISTGNIQEKPLLFAATEPEHHSSLFKLIFWTYDKLDEQERKVFRRLVVFSHSCCEAGAIQICNIGDLTKPVDTLLTSLERHYLITRTNGKIAYAHITLHDFADLLMKKKFQAELQQVSDLYFAYYAKSVTDYITAKYFEKKSIRELAADAQVLWGEIGNLSSAMERLYPFSRTNISLFMGDYLQSAGFLLNTICRNAIRIKEEIDAKDHPIDYSRSLIYLLNGSLREWDNSVEHLLGKFIDDVYPMEDGLFTLKIYIEKTDYFLEALHQKLIEIKEEIDAKDHPIDYPQVLAYIGEIVRLAEYEFMILPDALNIPSHSFRPNTELAMLIFSGAAEPLRLEVAIDTF